MVLVAPQWQRTYLDTYKRTFSLLEMISILGY